MAIRLGEILVDEKIITQEQLDEALKEHERTGDFLGQILIRRGFIGEGQLARTLSQQMGVPYLNLKEVPIDEALTRRVPAKLVWHYKIMPIKLDGNVLTVAISNPFDMWPLDDIEVNLGFRVERVLSTPSDITQAIKKYYGVGAETIESILEQQPTVVHETSLKERTEDIEKRAEDVSVITLVNQILHQAIKEGATDIHIEPSKNELSLRNRVDGILYDTAVSEDIRYLYPSIVSRIKIMAGLDIVEKRLPQDGRARVKLGNEEFDLRVSVLPSVYGENVVIRILPTTMLFSLEKLGLLHEDLKKLKELISKPHGIIFLTGPTGSGKTTTLYAALSTLNTSETKIITIEDPVEYELRRIHQIQVSTKIDLTFARALRSMLRHDPDIMMVGEVRDFETAEIAIQAALTGHLVFSTLHTNDASSGATRLLDMGVEPYLVASSVEAFIAQRLVRVICSHCKESYQLAPELRAFMEPKSSEICMVYRGKGCEMCRHTGYKGRTAIYEILTASTPIRQLIMTKASSDEIKQKAISLGMRTLKDDGWEKVKKGITTLEEVMRVTKITE
ncbi:MAG: GspE/PulE family protein [Candidatus Omnitrophota bacterium]